LRKEKIVSVSAYFGLVLNGFGFGVFTKNEAEGELNTL
jgi:hypothetical protein